MCVRDVAHKEVDTLLISGEHTVSVHAHINRPMFFIIIDSHRAIYTVFVLTTHTCKQGRHSQRLSAGQLRLNTEVRLAIGECIHGAHFASESTLSSPSYAAYVWVGCEL